MKAAQTGHLVLSTLHTNDSVSAIVRLLDLGIPGFMISSSVSAVVAQRLVRKLCSCHTVQPATADFQARIAQAGGVAQPAKMAVAIGCDRCDQTGYKGRIGIYELLRFDDSVRTVIRTTGNMDQIRETSRSNGMRLMQEDAIEKLRAGLTTMEEILRVVPFESAPNPECLKCGRAIMQSFKLCPYCGVPCGTKPKTSSTSEHESISRRASQVTVS
jgi:type II secretory ATPase GspE/PulE/Tfp pilus assembly ATPase PilB-like protein